MAPAAATKRALSSPSPETSGHAEFVLNARVEFYACMQLLADRARFITGADWAALGLREGDRFVYRAASGVDAPEVGSEASVKPEEIGTRESVAHEIAKSLLVAVVRDSKTEGFFQLASSGFEFSDGDRQSAERLAELVSTALEHMQAAENSDEVILSSATKPSAVSTPLSWHAPEALEWESFPKPAASGRAVTTDVPVCQSCGFPVSPGRAICMDCEERSVSGRPVTGLFSTEKPESWISAHGYTIATLAITAVAAALIYWLR
ncbi:MAG TPA: hypothetical protein VFA85_10335 [Terriglobales bacterium]|nr:hypothetical protein [Terriglobales bacterium]